MTRSNLPQIAKWYGTAPQAGGFLGVFLQTPDGQVHRFRVPSDDARHMAESLLSYLNHPVRTKVHSDKSSGKPASSVSSPLEGEKVCPPTRSSKAARGE